MRRFGNQLDLVHPGPEFAGDEQVLGLREPGDAVEDAVVLVVGGRGEQARQVDPAGDAAGLGVDDGDPLGPPDVGVDQAFTGLWRAPWG